MRLFGIIGYPLGHSYSESYFTKKFAAENLHDHLYRKFEIESIEDLPALLQGEKDLCGFNVTIPYKVKVLNYLDEIDPEAEEIGAVNTVRVTRRDGRVFLKGYNTDAPAFRHSLLGAISAVPETAVVLGTGGASKGVMHVLLDLGIRTISVSRTPSSGLFTYDDLPDHILSSAGLIVNTTPVGMAPHTDECPAIEYSQLQEGTLLFDLIYNPPVTKFMQMGEEHGCFSVNGEEMFLTQAELAWEKWNEPLK